MGGEDSPRLSVTDSERKVVYARFGRGLRAAAMVGAGYGAVDLWRIVALKRQVAECFPRLTDLDRATVWADQRPATKGKPVLGASSFENLRLNVGHGALGFTLACGTGEVVADLVQDRTRAMGVEPFRVGTVQ